MLLIIEITDNGLSTGLWKKAAGNTLAEGKKLSSLAAKSLLSSLASIEVVLSSLASNQLAILCYLDAL